jgi:hypothetical protein
MSSSTLACASLSVNRSALGAALLDVLTQDIARLSPQAVELVAALVSVQHALPASLVHWLLASLAGRADLRHISPAAEAAIQIGLASHFFHLDPNLLNKESEYTLLCALQKERFLDEAVCFLRLLAQRLSTFLVTR